MFLFTLHIFILTKYIFGKIIFNKINKTYKNIIYRYKPIAEDVTFFETLRDMRKARKENDIPEPSSIQEAAKLLSSYEPMTGFYQESLVTVNGSTAIIFFHKHMAEALRDCSQLFCDDSYEVISLFSLNKRNHTLE